MSVSRRKGGLGRGLDALIPGETTSGYLDVEVEAIGPNPTQPRGPIDPEDLTELADSIRQHGLLQPLVVTRRAPGEPGTPYLLVAGERRWRAARLVGLAVVPVIVRETAPADMLQLALVENLQRQDLNPIEAAEAYRHLVDHFGLTQERVAELVGKSRVTITNAIRLLTLPSVIKEAVASGEISEGHGRALLGLAHEGDRLVVCDIVRRNSLNVRQTEALVRRWGTGRPARATPAPVAADPDRRALEDSLRTTLGTRVEVSRGQAGRGRLVIHFYSDEQLDALYRRLLGDDE